MTPNAVFLLRLIPKGFMFSASFYFWPTLWAKIDDDDRQRRGGWGRMGWVGGGGAMGSRIGSVVEIQVPATDRSGDGEAVTADDCVSDNCA